MDQTTNNNRTSFSFGFKVALACVAVASVAAGFYVWNESKAGDREVAIQIKAPAKNVVKTNIQSVPVSTTNP